MASLEVQLTFSLVLYLTYFSVLSASVDHIHRTFSLEVILVPFLKGTFLKPKSLCGDPLCSVGLSSLLKREKQDVHQHNLVSMSRHTAGFSEEMQLRCISRTR